MFYYINGKLAFKGSNFVVIDVGGVGYKIYTSLSSIQQLNQTGENVKMFTYVHTREDVLDIYGFTTNEELSMFEILISVSGVGTKVALSILSTISSAQFAIAVVTNDVKAITKSPGVGPKLAQRIVLELKDKFKGKELDDLYASADAQSGAVPSGTKDEAVTALMVLGYSSAEARRAVDSFADDGMTIEEIIKQALKLLMKS